MSADSSGALKDGTKASQSGAFGVSSSEMRQGFTKIACERDGEFVDNPNAQALLGGNPTNFHGGFLGRPEGWQR